MLIHNISIACFVIKLNYASGFCDNNVCGGDSDGVFFVLLRAKIKAKRIRTKEIFGAQECVYALP